MIKDLTHLQPNPPPPTRRRDRKTGKIKLVPKAQIIRGRVVERDARDIRGITLHQTACYFGPGKVPKGRTRAEMIHERALRVHAHTTVFSDGVAVRGYPLTWYVYHGHDFCADTVGQEHEGKFDEDGNIIDAPADYSVERVIVAGREAIEATCNELGHVEYIRLHRQTSSKDACPGRLIHREVGLWSAKRFGLRFDPDLTRRNGTPIPLEWRTDAPRI